MRACCLAPFAVCLLAGAQTMVEHGVATAGGSGAAAGMSGAGKSISGIFGKVNEAAGASGQKARPAKRRSKAKSKAKAKPKPEPVETYTPGTACIDNPARIAIGLTSAEVVSTCGVPAARSETEEGGEVFWFTGRSRDVVVTLARGKVTSVRPKEKRSGNGGVVITQ